MSFRAGSGQREQEENVATFFVRLWNFFRHPRAAADVPTGMRWTDRDVYDPWCDRFWT